MWDMDIVYLFGFSGLLFKLKVRIPNKVRMRSVYFIYNKQIRSIPGLAAVAS